MTETCLVPAEVNVHVSVELPEPVRLAGETVHDVLFVVRLTTPVKPLTAETVIVEVPGAFAFTVTVEGLEVSVKSWITKVTMTECDRLPFAPVTLTCTLPAELSVHESVELPDPVTVVGVMLQRVLFVARFTAPANPLTLDIVIVEVAWEPAFASIEVGLAAMVKF